MVSILEAKGVLPDTLAGPNRQAPVDWLNILNQEAQLAQHWAEPCVVPTRSPPNISWVTLPHCGCHDSNLLTWKQSSSALPTELCPGGVSTLILDIEDESCKDKIFNHHCGRDSLCTSTRLFLYSKFVGLSQYVSLDDEHNNCHGIFTWPS